MKMILNRPKYRIRTLFLICFMAGASVLMHGQKKELSEVEKLFLQIEEGFADNSVDKFSGYFLEKIYLSFVNETPKYYSANQAYYVVKNFLSIYTPTGFKIEFSSSVASSPFASGELKYIKNGMKGKVKVLVTLKNVNNQWKISQITIN